DAGAARRGAAALPELPRTAAGRVAYTVPPGCCRLHRLERAGAVGHRVAGARSRQALARGRSRLRPGRLAPPRSVMAVPRPAVHAGLDRAVLAARERNHRLGRRPRAPGAGAAAMKVRGTLEFRDLEGGLWQLKAEDGKRYTLLGRIDASSGARVEVEGHLDESGF